MKQNQAAEVLAQQAQVGKPVGDDPKVGFQGGVVDKAKFAARYGSSSDSGGSGVSGQVGEVGDEEDLDALLAEF